MLAHCDPNDFGDPQASPLCKAIKSGDSRAVSQLLKFRVNPNRAEDGQNVPIFAAIAVSSEGHVHMFIKHRAKPRAKEVIPATLECRRGRRVVKRRTALEVAVDKPPIRSVLLDAITQRLLSSSQLWPAPGGMEVTLLPSCACRQYGTPLCP